MLKNAMVLLFAACFLITTALAQPTLQRDSVYKIGDSYTLLAAEIAEVDPGPAGANQTWDFRNVARGPLQGDMDITWVDPADVPGSANYPDANVAEFRVNNQGNGYLFYQDTGDGLLVIGLETPEFQGPYTDPSRNYSYPMNFNDRFEDTWSGTFNALNLGVGERSGTQIVTYDGYGTLHTPYTTYENAIRLSVIRTVSERYTANGTVTRIEIELQDYLWYVPGVTLPVFSHIISQNRVYMDDELVLDTPANAGFWIEAESTGSNGGGNGNGGESGRYGSHVTVQGGNFETSLLVTNASGTAQTVDIQPISASGETLTPIPIAAAGNSAQRVPQASIFSADVSHFTVSGSDDVKVSVGYRAATGGADAPVHEAPPIESNFYLYPGEPDLLFDGVALVNAGSAPATINATWLNETGGVMGSETIVTDLAVGAKQLALFDQLFPNLDGSGIIRIEPSEPVGAMILRGSRDGQYLYQNLPVQAASGDRWIPHLTAVGGNFTTDVFLHNASGTPQSATLLPFTAAGAPQPNLTLDVPANGFMRVEQTQLNESGYSHFMLDAPSEVTASVGYRAAVSGASTAQVHETTPIARTFFLYPGDWDLVYDAVAIVNTGSADATVTATQIGVTGPKGEAVTLVDGLAPNAKSLLVLGTVFNGESSEAIRIDTTQPLALLVLRGSLDGRYLYLNPPIPE